MVRNMNGESAVSQQQPKKVLLLLLPFWDPLVPPLGIASLKAFLEANGNYCVNVFDANIEPVFRDIYDRYFGEFKVLVPPEKRRLLYNMGHEVLKNHTMAFIHNEGYSESEYVDLIIEIVYQTFYTRITEEQARFLDLIIKDYLSGIEIYVKGKIDQFKPAIFGLSVYSGSLPASIYSFKFVKRLYPEILTIMGGPVFSNEMKPNSPNYFKLMNETPFIDKVIEGEAEILMLKLLDGQLKEDKKFYSVKDIGNLSVDLGSSPIPDFTDIDMDSYLTVSSSTGRSCPFECSFCSETIFWGRYKKKTPEFIVAEMKRLHHIYKKQLIFMCDSILNPVLESLTSELIKHEEPIYFDGYFRIDKKSQDLKNVLNWRRGGYYRARMGVESGAEEMLQLMHKDIKVPQIKQTIINLATAGIKTTAMFVVGHPGETEEHFQMTLDLIESIQDYIYEADCNPFQFFYSGQVDSTLWESQFKKLSLYPEKYDNMIFSKTWTLDVCPLREIAYERANRFVEHVAKLGIQNPYTLEEIRKADDRWTSLHKNAVPSMLDLQHGNIARDERRRVKEYSIISDPALDVDLDEWNF